jgi:hypothetical protein
MIRNTAEPRQTAAHGETTVFCECGSVLVRLKQTKMAEILQLH